MLEEIMRMHARSSRALALTVAMLAIWAAAFCYSVFETAMGRPQALLCLVAAGAIVQDPLRVALAGLAVSRSLERRSVRIRALAVRRGILGGRGRK